MAFGALVPQPHAASGRHGARERRRHQVGRPRHRRTRSSRRDLEPGHRDVDDRRRHSTTGVSTTRRRSCSPTAACSWPAEGSCPARARSTRRTPSSTRRRTSSRARGRRSHRRRPSASYGASFDVTTPNAAQIAKVSLIRSPSVTHAFDQNQRFQFLNFTVGCGQGHGAGAGEREPRAARRLHALPRRHERRSVGWLVPPRVDGQPTRRRRRRPPASSATAPPGQVALSWAAATDAGGVARYNVHRAHHRPASRRRPRTGSPSRPAPATPTAASLPAPTTTRSRPRTPPATSAPASNEANATVADRRARQPASWPRGGSTRAAAPTTADKSGNGNTGTLSNATWSTTGKFGNALSFNGTNASVSVADSNSLDLTTGHDDRRLGPAGDGGGFQTLIVKERPGDLVYGLYSNSDTNRPQSQVTVSPPARAAPTARPRCPPGSGRTSRPRTTAPPNASTSTAPRSPGRRRRLDHHLDLVRVRIGGNTIWSEWFNGAHRRGAHLQPRPHARGDPDAT